MAVSVNARKAAKAARSQLFRDMLNADIVRVAALYGDQRTVVRGGAKQEDVFGGGGWCIIKVTTRVSNGTVKTYRIFGVIDEVAKNRKVLAFRTREAAAKWAIRKKLPGHEKLKPARARKA